MKTASNIGAIILAAGRGARMGSPKWKLRLDDTDFLGHIIACLREASITSIIAIAASSEVELIAARYPELAIAVNPAPERGMISSVRIGAEAMREISTLIIPVDHPHVALETYQKLTLKSATFYGVIKPLYRGESGHPIVVPRDWAATLDPEESGGLRAAITKTRLPILYVPVDDSGILKNLNEPSDLV